MAKKDLPNIDTLRQLVCYNPDTGKLYWKERTIDLCLGKHPKRTLATFNSFRAGKEIGSLNNQGYISMEIYGIYIDAHIVCWALYYGKIPDFEIDHSNGVKNDNRICNLREANDSQQQANKPLSIKSTTGHKGVYSLNKKWRAKIYHDNKNIHLGVFDTINEAIEARKTAEIKYHGEFARMESQRRSSLALWSSKTADMLRSNLSKTEIAYIA